MADQEQAPVQEQDPFYSEKYFDDVYEYRHVMLPPTMAQELQKMLKTRALLTEDEWRDLGVMQSPGWVHYALHKPEPHIMLFRRRLVDSPAPPAGAMAAIEKQRAVHGVAAPRENGHN